MRARTFTVPDAGTLVIAAHAQPHRQGARLRVGWWRLERAGSPKPLEVFAVAPDGTESGVFLRVSPGRYVVRGRRVAVSVSFATWDTTELLVRLLHA